MWSYDLWPDAVVYRVEAVEDGQFEGSNHFLSGTGIRLDER